MAKKSDKTEKPTSASNGPKSKKDAIAELRSQAAKTAPKEKPKPEKLPVTQPLYLKSDNPDEMPLAEQEALMNLNADLRLTASKLGKESARMFVDLFYQIQKMRIGCGGQYRAARRNQESTAFFAHQYGNLSALERQVKMGLDSFVSGYSIGNWMKSINGIAELTAAGMLAYIDIRQAPTVGHIWRFAGIAGDEQPWFKKKEAAQIVSEVCGKRGKITDEHVEQLAARVMRKADNFRRTALRCSKSSRITREGLRRAVALRPYCKAFKTFVCGRVGSALLQRKNDEANIYYPIYAARRALLEKQNEEGKFHDYALERVETVGEKTKAHKWYERGLLPPDHIHRRANRVMVKILLSHIHTAMYEEYHCKPAPLLYILTKDPAHTHLIKPPNWPGKFEGRTLRQLFGEQEPSISKHNKPLDE